MSRQRSDEERSDPLRPSDHIDGVAEPVSSAPDDEDGGITQPRLGIVGWLRWAWRQLTSMRTALVLLLLLAIAAVPGSIFPQRSADPNGVTQYFADNPDLAPILDKIQLFDVYDSAWFSAIYILLFISLIGCVIPRTVHHAKALRSRPPRTPVRLARLTDHSAITVRIVGDDGDSAAESVMADAVKLLRASRYRVERYDRGAVRSVSAERGYLRETGNLLFHVALLGVLIVVGVGGSYTYTGQRAIIEGTSFTNALTYYSSFNPGRFVNAALLSPYSISLDSFDVSYVASGEAGQGQAGDFVAHVTTTEPDGESTDGEVRVNHPLQIAGDSIYLMGNGYAPTITVRDPDGNVVFHDSVAFLPQDSNMTSLGVVKVTDGMSEQLGLVGYFYPTAQPLDDGTYESVYPDLVYPMLSLNVYAGDLGIDDGTARSVYTLDPTGMTQLAGGGTDTAAIQLLPGETADLPNGMGTVTFEDETDGASVLSSTDYSQSVKRYVSLSIHHDVAAPWVLMFATIAVLGLLLALFVPRRRLWVKATSRDGTLRIEYAGLARGEDPTLAAAVAQLADRHTRGLRDRPDDFEVVADTDAAAAPARSKNSRPAAKRPRI